MKITKEELLDFGMFEVQGNESILSPMKKVIHRKDGELMSIVLWTGRNIPELCIFSTDGVLIYLDVDSIQELEVIEKSISEWEIIS